MVHHGCLLHIYQSMDDKPDQFWPFFLFLPLKTLSQLTQFPRNKNFVKIMYEEGKRPKLLRASQEIKAIFREKCLNSLKGL